MARIRSDLSNVQTMKPVPKGLYPGRISKVVVTETASTKNPMLVLDWTIESGDYRNREIRFDNIVLGGRNDRGEAINPFRLLSLISALNGNDRGQFSWTCTGCGVESTGVPVLGTGPQGNGLEEGHYFCPACGAPFQVEFDDAALMGCTCQIAVDVQKSNRSDREFSTVTGYGPPVD